MKILREANYQGWVTLEYESKADPFEGVPPLLAQLRSLIAGGPAGPKGEAEWKPLFHGKKLEPWKPTNFAGAGEVRVEKGQITMDAGNDLTGINLAEAPAKMDYEVVMDAMRIEGDDFFCGFTFPVGDTHVSLIVGGWAGSVIGISHIKGDAAIENETTQFKKFDSGKWYRIRVRVTKPKIEAWIDDEQMVNLETADKTLAIRAGEIESSMPFGIATWRTKGALRDIKWRKVQK